ncbi:hypothetical protein ACN28C_23595 [Plantactinospora sp. WMMC1484]|uniref:hypothetical protein n=1 Tax=Plantactinospora sp. WMMC1484 TaxID=3404122 RepID=UPI003BF55D11
MMLDERVSRALTEMSEGLRPEPDPYARVLARHRRSRRRRAVAAGLCAVAVVASTGAAVALRGQGGGPDTVAVEPAGGWQRMVAWGQRLVDSPPRGAVGRDAGYVAALAESLRAEQAAGRFERLTVPVREVRVLFVDDVGPYRVALAAFVRAAPDPGTQWVNAAHWFVAPAGAGPQELGRASAGRSASDGLAPHEEFTFGDLTRPDELLHVSVAPEGCDFSTAPVAELTGPAPRWSPEPTGDYLVRPPGSHRAEWWQITCAGVVRARLAAPVAVTTALTDEQAATAVAGARGTADGEWVRRDLGMAAETLGNRVTALPGLVWAGRIQGSPSGRYDGSVSVVAAPAADGEWAGQVIVEYDERGPDNILGARVDFDNRTDPTHPGSLVAVRLDGTSTLLVIAPAGSRTVRAVRDGQEMASGTVTGDALLLTVPDLEGITLEARDAAGTPVGTGEVAGESQDGFTVNAWDRE